MYLPHTPGPSQDDPCDARLTPAGGGPSLRLTMLGLAGALAAVLGIAAALQPHHATALASNAMILAR